MAKKRRLSKADKLKRENIKWVFMFVLLVLTIAVYLASFIEADKTQSSIDFNKKTLVKLTEDLKVKKNSVERMKRADVIDNGNIIAGNVIVGLSSFGKASYEEEYNSGIGSNGLTSARHDVFEKSLKNKYPESFDNQISDELVYSGTKKVTDNIENSLLNAGKLVLSPTRTYAPLIKKIFEEIERKKINGIIHCSGGAQTKILHFVDKLHIIKDNLFDLPPVFKLIQQESGTSWKEMYQVFNMGHRMEIYTDRSTAEKIINISNGFNIEAKIVGRVEDSKNKKLTITSTYGTFEY